MIETIVPILFLTALGSIFAIVIVLANKKLKVWEDPRIDVVSDFLPGANCGACGAAGCRAFAEEVVGLKLPPSKCSVGGAVVAEDIASYLGIDPGKAEKMVARLLCAGGHDVAPQSAIYQGSMTCRGASTVVAGDKACSYGCLGLGDCAAVCMFKAISMGPTGLPMVDVEKCTACGDCVRVCPKSLFEIMPLQRHLIVQCKSQLEGEKAEALCKVACTACGKCAMDAPKLITMKNNLPVINPDLIELEDRKATMRCPTGAIAWVEGSQFAHLRPSKSKAAVSK